MSTVTTANNYAGSHIFCSERLYFSFKNTTFALTNSAVSSCRTPICLIQTIETGRTACGIHHYERPMRYIAAMTIAGSDSCGGAGIQADIKTMSALGVYAASVITAVTAQNTLGVTGIEAVSPAMIAAQIRAVMDDIRPLAVKIGMVNDAETVIAIADTLADYIAGKPAADTNILYKGMETAEKEPAKEASVTVKHIVVDPVMVATSGSKLMAADAVEAFIDRLLPIATVLTPNIPEAEVLSGITINDISTCEKAGRSLSKRCPGYVLIKGGHADEGDKKRDRLFKDGEMVMTVEAEAIDTPNTHGTGCTLSSAIAALLARGMDITKAIRTAKTYVSRAIRAGSDVQTGGGHGPVNHFFDPQALIIE